MKRLDSFYDNEKWKEVKEKKELQQRLNLVTEIFKLSMKINTETDYYCFLNLYPHVEQVDLHITPKSDYTNRLYEERDICYEYDEDYREYNTHQDMMAKLQEVKSELEGYCD